MGNDGWARYTHVANTSGGTIYVRVSTERSHIVMADVRQTAKSNAGINGVTVGAEQEFATKYQYIWNEFKKEGFTKMSNGSLERFYTGSDSNHNVFVTVYCELHGLSTENRQIEPNQSVIVLKDGVTKVSKHNKVWEPEYG